MSRHYATAYQNHFWKWEQDGEDYTICLANGATIVYHKHLLDLLEKMIPFGFPPFGSLLLALVATNPNAKAHLDYLTPFFHGIEFNNQEDTTKAFAFLSVLRSLPQEYKVGNKRFLLLKTIFKDCHNKLGKNTAQQVVEKLSDPNGTYVGLSQPMPLAESQNHLAYREIHTLALLGNKFQRPEDILNEMAGLPRLEPEELPNLQETTSKEHKDFVQELIDHEKSFYVGALIKTIWSGLDLPFHHAAPSDQPLGGVSDLSNKGNYDKLLISEFANNDMVLMSRLANNEALFLHREAPPIKNKIERVILIDVSLKNWGTPKTLAHAVMLAIAKHPKSDFKCQCFALGNQYSELGIESRDDVIEGLAVVEASLHAEKGLEAYFNEHPKQADQQIIFISSKEAMQTGSFQKAISDFGQYLDFRIITSPEGKISLYKLQLKSLKHIQDIKLSLDGLWQVALQKLAKKVKLGQHEIDKFPLLFCNDQYPRAVLNASDGSIFIITKRGFLLRFHGSRSQVHQIGWEWILPKITLPKGDYEIGFENNAHYLLCHNYEHGKMTIFNLEDATSVNVDFIGKRMDYEHPWLFNNGCFYYQGQHQTTIRLDGTKELGINQEPSLFESRLKELKTLKREYSGNRAVLRNIERVRLTEGGYLGVNKHVLGLNSHGVISFENKPLETLFEAERLSESEFLFADGSKVSFLTLGAYVLKSSNRDIPTIYIPSLLNGALGVCTNEEYAGISYFLPSSGVDISIEEVGSKKMDVIKALTEAGVGLKDAIQMVGDASQRIEIKLSALDNLKQKLQRAYCKYKVSQKSIFSIIYPDNEQGRRTFYNKYIQPFIDQIINHEAKSKAK